MPDDVVEPGDYALWILNGLQSKRHVYEGTVPYAVRQRRRRRNRQARRSRQINRP